jgi:hypothetical protein
MEAMEVRMNDSRDPNLIGPNEVEKRTDPTDLGAPELEEEKCDLIGMVWDSRRTKQVSRSQNKRGRCVVVLYPRFQALFDPILRKSSIFA